MSKPAVFFNDYLSIAVMLLMVVALVAGQADASTERSDPAFLGNALEYPVIEFDNSGYLEFRGRVTGKAVEVSINVVKELGHFRGEDE